MAIKYEWELITNRELKKKIKNKNKLSAKEEKIRNKLFHSKIWFIWPKPAFLLFEGKIIEIFEKEYEVRVRPRKWKLHGEYVVMKINKRNIHFEK